MMAPMDRDSLQRMVQRHQAYAGLFLAEFRRLWERELSAEESSCIRDGTLCLSLSSLESMERWLAVGASPQDADRRYAQLRTEVARHAASVVWILRQNLELPGGLPEPSAFPDLLAWEEALAGPPEPGP